MARVAPSEHDHAARKRTGLEVPDRVRPLLHWLSAVVALIVLSGCAFDQRRTLAFDLLHDADGMEHPDLYASAFRQRFPAGSEASALRAFVLTHRGECSESAAEIKCELVTRGGLCWASLIKLGSPLRDGRLGELQVVVGGLGC
jgi:hypothetical protein